MVDLSMAIAVNVISPDGNHATRQDTVQSSPISTPRPLSWRPWTPVASCSVFAICFFTKKMVKKTVFCGKNNENNAMNHPFGNTPPIKMFFLWLEHWKINHPVEKGT